MTTTDVELAAPGLVATALAFTRRVKRQPGHDVAGGEVQLLAGTDATLVDAAPGAGVERKLFAGDRVAVVNRREGHHLGVVGVAVDGEVHRTALDGGLGEGLGGV